MSDQQRREAEAIFQETLEQPGEHQTAFVTARCGGDEGLFAEVHALLGAHAAEALPMFQETAVKIRPGEQPGDMIGPYKILSLLGEGGMGIVFLAEQSVPLHRRVALKVIKVGMDTKQVIRRFDTERQALALMNHPNVARVYDAGATANGRPYFAMEYVSGEPLTDYCDRQRLNTKERLGLFMQTCGAVQHAHQKGIIHRDLKPSNVLVMVQENETTVKVIDFGLAKATAQQLTERTLFTEAGQLIGTPEYMSPEQAEGDVDIDTRTDVYSLGVLLFQLLTGELPFDARELRRGGYAEIHRMIREVDPPKPSTRLGQGEKAAASGDDSWLQKTAHRHRVDPRTLIREVRGDLDWIVMKALEKDRTRRYETANALAMDIARHLSYEPIVASPPSASYRMRKFARRNRAGVAVGMVLAVTLLAAAVVSTGFAFSEARQRRETMTERDIAQAVNDFLNRDLLAAVAPSAEKGRGKDVLMRDVLDEAAKRIDDASDAGGRFDGKPLVEAAIRTTLGVTYRQLGEYPAAEPHLKRSLELRRSVLGNEHLSTLTSLNNLALLFWNQGLHEDAEPLYREAIDTGTRVLGDEHPERLGWMNNLAALYFRQGRYDDAEPLFSEVLDLRRRVLGEEHPSTLNSISNLAGLYQEQERYDDAVPLYVQALEMFKRVRGEEHPDTLLCLNNLANLYMRQGLDEKAEPLLVDVVRIRKRVLSEEHPETLRSMGGLANLYKSQGLYDEAEALFIQVLDVQTRVLREGHPSTLFTKMNLAELYGMQEEFEKAARLQQEATTAARGTWPEGTWFRGAFLGDYGSTLIKLQRYEDAEPTLLEAAEILTGSLGPQHGRTVAVGKSLADVYDHLEKPDKAAEWRAKLPSGQTAVGKDK